MDELENESKLFYLSLPPVVGLTLAVSDGRYPDTGFKLCVKDEKWKALEDVAT